MTKISESIEKIVKPLIKVQTLRGEVIAIDKKKDTCEVRPLSGGAPYLDVRLKSIIAETNTRHVIYPKIGSIVHISLIENNEADTYVSQISEFESLTIENKELKLELLPEGKIKIEAKEIELNGGKLGGLVKAGELKKQIDKNSRAIRLIQEAFSLWTPVPGDGGAVLKTASTAFVNAQRANLSNIENKKVNHG